jgi:REP element-mobilizing transposase RayT
MPNHFHLLLRPTQNNLAQFMRRLLTGYAVTFNLRHDRQVSWGKSGTSMRSSCDSFDTAARNAFFAVKMAKASPDMLPSWVTLDGV